MYPKNEGILDQGYWEGQPDQKCTSRGSRALQWALDIIRPSFLTRRGGRQKELMKTSWLDGLRGFAAFLVYWHHHTLWAHEGSELILESGFGFNNQHYFASFHFIRNFFTGGHFAVAIFFVISGYVLSAKPLTLIYAGEWTKLNDNLASAVFRRWLRLYIPIICTTFVFVTLHHTFGFWTLSVKRESNYRDGVWMWYAELKNFTFLFNAGGEPWFTYNPHLWTIPHELKGSIIVYTTALALSRCSKPARLWCQTGLIFYFLYIVDGWPCALFAMGQLLSELDLLAEKKELPRFFYSLEAYKDLIFYNLFFIGMYLGGVPSHNNEIKDLRASPGWYALSFLQPQAVFNYKAFYLFWAAAFVVPAVPRIHWLKSFFETRFCQYLGRISFALYLVHGPVLWVLGDRLYVAVGWVREAHKEGIPGWVDLMPLPKWGPFGLEVAFLLPHLVLLPFTLWMAECVAKLFDDPAVRFGRWLYRRTLAPVVR
ncbi:acyltransferase family-domain-containing protein [Hyaloscypha finlandica]|nr:acyltransferase family-domain-containing protein [Hyaloscypha finlandica]